MGWQREEVWFDADVLWFREKPTPPFPSFVLSAPAFASPAPVVLPGLAAPFPATGPATASERRRQAARRRRRATQTLPAVALVLGSAVMVPMAWHRHADGVAPRALPEDPPSQTVRLSPAAIEALQPPVVPAPEPALPAETRHAEVQRADVETNPGDTIPGDRVAPRRVARPALRRAPRQRDAAPRRRPRLGHVEPDRERACRTSTDRLYANEHTIHRILAVLAAYRSANVRAPRVVIGDLSYHHGGRMDDHVSHQNGLDVDVYYPRRDRTLHEPTATDQIDRGLAQDLLDRFVAAGRREGLRRVLDRAARSRRGRRALSEPPEPHARPLPAPVVLTIHRPGIPGTIGPGEGEYPSEACSSIRPIGPGASVPRGGRDLRTSSSIRGGGVRR